MYLSVKNTFYFLFKICWFKLQPLHCYAYIFILETLQFTFSTDKKHSVCGVGRGIRVKLKSNGLALQFSRRGIKRYVSLVAKFYHTQESFPDYANVNTLLDHVIRLIHMQIIMLSSAQHFSHGFIVWFLRKIFTSHFKKVTGICMSTLACTGEANITL